MVYFSCRDILVTHRFFPLAFCSNLLAPAHFSKRANAKTAAEVGISGKTWSGIFFSIQGSDARLTKQDTLSPTWEKFWLNRLKTFLFG